MTSEGHFGHLFTVVTLCAQLTRDLLAIAKFLVHCVSEVTLKMQRAPAAYLNSIINKKLSCRREAARCFVFVSSQLQHTYSAVFLLLVTAASDLLVIKFY